jgi:hypothetical protein
LKKLIDPRRSMSFLCLTWANFADAVGPRYARNVIFTHSYAYFRLDNGSLQVDMVQRNNVSSRLYC